MPSGQVQGQGIAVEKSIHLELWSDAEPSQEYSEIDDPQLRKTEEEAVLGKQHIHVIQLIVLFVNFFINKQMIL